mmetsp:Transcript_33617/g.77567  ORF Transcript_33617/g.77567 Transcript_33617/m.77567 type:complete len:81 (+) Transcript_33617:844-1086(+)|eukprot:CAMPEP_0113300366 /NCGR_PEP_ID=MMETSP0010_2-20120614/2029_1 /TAXON_ID=216773 ORGANISM="Corethron hystrix, Strain 308" /NCGR_SAMPLE_ID=MMETSP0010_2 /ASSEMBLY_ACC=CAM_ASM_000155 /LENGTH=80 /DNA_ID=CAMNT_0000153785 /DNA_START=812 /DNA_END=1054 /DNA_ORIENTATION=+ /assembly_acc=CAM_ASM_000155
MTALDVERWLSEKGMCDKKASMEKDFMAELMADFEVSVEVDDFNKNDMDTSAAGSKFSKNGRPITPFTEKCILLGNMQKM